jgi:hypothetical protein
MKILRWILIAAVLVGLAAILKRSIQRSEEDPQDREDAKPSPDAQRDSGPAPDSTPDSNLDPQLLELMAPHRRYAFDPACEDGEADGPESKFGGRPWLREGDSWPTCGSCGQPLALFLQLDLAKLPLGHGIQGEGLLQFFHCLGTQGKDECWETYEAYSEAELVRLYDSTGSGKLAAAIQGVETTPPKRILSWRPIDDYPGEDSPAEAPLRLTDEQRRHLEELRESQPEAIPKTADGDKLGGYPFWVQSPELPSCPRCKKQMRYVFQIDSEDQIPYMWGDSGVGHISQCADHPDVLAFVWACY